MEKDGYRPHEGEDAKSLGGEGASHLGGRPVDTALLESANERCDRAVELEERAEAVDRDGVELS